MTLRVGRVFALISLILSGSALCVGQAESIPKVRYPNPDVGIETLVARARAQQATQDQFKVFYQFHFTDKLSESGITFMHRVVDDAAANYKAVHYDHGTGLAAADVDGDGLYDIYFVNQVGENELWKNLGGGKFRNITQEAKVGAPGRIHVGASFADIDNDGDEDLFVTTVLGGNVLFDNDGHGHFTDITKEAGLDLVSHSSGAVFFDYDNDGLVDLLVCNVGKYTVDEMGAQGQHIGYPAAFTGYLHPSRFEYPVLYKNMGHNHFKDVTEEVGLRATGWAGDASFADFDSSGFPGVFVLNMSGHSHYFANVSGKFVEETPQRFPETTWGAMGLKFFDFDNDGHLDLLVTDMHSDMSGITDPDQEKMKTNMLWPDWFVQAWMRLFSFVQPAPYQDYIWGNAFYRNQGNGRFEEVSDRIGAENYWPWGVSVGDLNADGWDDVFITSGMSFPFRYGINSLLLNNRGERFLDAEFLLGIEPRKDPYTPWFQMDCSSPSTTSRPLMKKVCGDRTGIIEVMAPRSSRSSVMFDLDDDGDLDLVVADFNSEPMILINDLAQQKPIHWTKVALQGTASNRDGFGATVRVFAGGQTYTKYNDGKSGYLSQSALPLYFGLGDTDKLDRIEVDWPSGRKQTLTSGLAENRLIQITEPK
jgi:hypothetical protein